MEIKDSVFLVTEGTSGLGAATVRMILVGGGEAVIADENRAFSPRPRSRPQRSVRVLAAWSPPPAGVLKIIEER